MHNSSLTVTASMLIQLAPRLRGERLLLVAADAQCAYVCLAQTEYATIYR